MASFRIRWRRFVVAALIVVTSAQILAFAWPAAGATSAQIRSRVLVARVKDTITPVIADHLREGIEIAQRDGRTAFLVELDTPGGLDTSMRDIVQAFLAARLPVIVYVAPHGARAASAGAFITMAAHVAAMAPGTTIGASTPIDLHGGDISDKVINDAAAYAESIARARPPPPDAGSRRAPPGQAHRRDRATSDRSDPGVRRRAS